MQVGIRQFGHSASAVVIVLQVMYHGKIPFMVHQRESSLAGVPGFRRPGLTGAADAGVGTSSRTDGIDTGTSNITVKTLYCRRPSHHPPADRTRPRRNPRRSGRHRKSRVVQSGWNYRPGSSVPRRASGQTRPRGTFPADWTLSQPL